MHKVVGYGIFWTFVVSFALSWWALLSWQLWMLLGYVLVSFACGIYVFKGTLNLVQGIGFVYWVTRDTHKGFSLALAFMRETDHPWRTGRGLQIGIKKYSFQIGFCRRHTTHTEAEGLMRAVKGRRLYYRPKEIREWL